MSTNVSRPSAIASFGAAILVAAGSIGAAWSAPAVPNPCKLATVAEIEQIVGPLKGAPRATDPASGEITCSYEPAKGPSFIDISLHNGDIAAWKTRNGGKNPVAVPEFGNGAFSTPDFQDFAEVYVKKGDLILRVSVPKGPQAVEMVKAIARKALPRL
ncbi:MAG: hypothetical protein ABIO45_00075 [Burkholderiaceae bacterium]